MKNLVKHAYIVFFSLAMTSAAFGNPEKDNNNALKVEKNTASNVVTTNTSTRPDVPGEGPNPCQGGIMIGGYCIVFQK